MVKRVETTIYIAAIYSTKTRTLAGERYDLATGEPIDNSTVTELDGLTITDEAEDPDDDLEELKEAISSDKDASKWLKEHADQL